jgi:hypothetical protein
MSSEESGSENEDRHGSQFFSLAKEDTEMGEADSGVADVETEDSCTESGFSGDESDDGDDNAYAPVSRESTGDEATSARKNPPRSVRSRESHPSPLASHFAHEVKAAHALLHLHMQNADDSDSLEAIQNARKRRCASL